MQDMVILAAGRGKRMSQSVGLPEFWKPLAVVNGRPLLAHLVEVGEVTCRRVVVVCSPGNVTAVNELVGHYDHVRLVVQGVPIGPADAAARGAEACDTKQIVVLAGDNIITVDDVLRCTTDAEVGREVVGVHNTGKREGLTRWRKGHGWVEKETVTKEDDFDLSWHGPLVLKRARVTSWIEGSQIGPRLPEDFMTFTQVTCGEVG